MLPKNRRVLRSDFSHIIKTGKRYNSPHLLLYLAKINGNNHTNSKISFSVSKTVCKSAAGRNRLRRQGYGVISKKINSIESNHFLFFSFKKESFGINYRIIEKEVLELLSVSGVLK